MPLLPLRVGGSPSTILFRTHRLRFFDDGNSLTKEVEFEALDATQALFIAYNEASEHSAELWREEQKLCTIRRDGSGTWVIGGAA